MSNTPSNIIDRNIAEQHRSLFNLKAFGIDNDGKVVDGGKVSKLDSQVKNGEEF